MKPDGVIYNTMAARRPQWRYGMVVLIALAVSMLMAIFHPLGTAEWYLIDQLTQWRHSSSHPAASVAAVLIDDDAVNQPHGWPIAKSAYEELALYLLEMGASAIVFDVLFADDLTCGDTSDAGFLRTVEHSPALVFSWLAYTDDFGTIDRSASNALAPFAAGVNHRPGVTGIAGVQLPYTRLMRVVTTAGFMNRGHPYADNVERRMPLIAAHGDSSLQPSLAMAAVMRARKISSVEWDGASGRLSLGSRRIPCDTRGEMLLDFGMKVPAYPLSEVRRSIDEWVRGNKPTLDSSAFAGRIVFVGNGAVSLHDFGVTPLSRSSVPSYTPNVLLHARSAATLLAGTAPRCVSTLWQIGIMVLMILTLPFIRFAFPRYRRFVIAVSLLMALPVIASYLLYNAGIIIFPLALSLSAGVFLLCDFVGAHRFNVHPADAPKAYTGDGPYLFISYKHEQLREASRIMFQLQAMGCSIWYDRAIHPGAEWKKVIENRIRQSQGVFFMASPEAVFSSEIQDELCHALEERKTIIPVCIDHGVYDLLLRESEDTKKIDATVLEYCRNTQMIDLYSRQFKRLLESRLKDMGVIV